MTLETAGLALGTIGLAGLFRPALDVWDFVDAGRGCAEEFDLLHTRLDNQRQIFVQWGRNMDFGSEGGYNILLDEPEIRPRIVNTLNHIKLLFTNTDDLTNRYGIRVEETQPDGVVMNTNPSQSHQTWQKTYEGFRNMLRFKQKQLSIRKVTRWSVRDAKKFKIMVEHASELLCDLEKMTQGFAPESRYLEIVREEVAKIEIINHLQQTCNAVQANASRAENIMFGAAAARIRQLEQQNEQLRLTNASGNFSLRRSIKQECTRLVISSIQKRMPGGTLIISALQQQSTQRLLSMNATRVSDNWGS